MSDNSSQTRGSFSSRLGFILASAGSAIGLGNLWKFPYVAGTNGGGLFFIIYMLFMVILGIPIIFTEISIGRATKLNPIDAYSSLNKKCGFIGLFGILASFLIICFYSVVGGWVLKYFFKYLLNADFGAQPEKYFSSFTAQALEPVIWHAVFLIVSVAIVALGISKGIEKVSKVILPALFVIIIILGIRAVTLEGSFEGIKYLFFPHTSQLSSLSDFGDVAVLALGQVFFSLSLGSGVSITYGSYITKKSNLLKDSVMISVLDTSIAVLASIAIIPAVFAFGLNVSEGPGLIFETLTLVFDNIVFGRLFGTIFFLLVFFAAITSSISMLEVAASYIIDHFKVSRIKTVTIISAIVLVIGAFASLSMGAIKIELFSMPIFDLLDYISSKFLMPITAFATCVYMGYFYKGDIISSQFENKKILYNIYRCLIRYITPVLILIIFIWGLI